MAVKRGPRSKDKLAAAQPPRGKWWYIPQKQRLLAWTAAGLAVFLMILYLGFHGRYGLFDVDEAIFTQATREMMDNGTYSMPTYNGEPRYQKPPLIYWLQAGAMAVLGQDSLWAARLPSAIFALLTIGLLGYGVTRLTNNGRWGLVAAAAMGLNLSFAVVGRAATADAVLNFFMLALALWVLRVIYMPVWKWSWVVTGALFALGILAKGPVAAMSAALIVVPLLIFLPEHFKTRWKLIWRLEPFKVLVVTLVGLLPWLFVLVIEGRLAFFAQFLLVENFQRFGGGFGNSHSGSHWYYLIVLLLGFMPWVFLLPRPMWAVVQGWRKRVQSDDIRDALPILALVWAVGIIGFFSFSGTRLPHYIVPAYPALAILVGWGLIPTRKHTPVTMTGVEVWAGIQLVLVALLIGILPWAVEGLRQPQLTGVWGWLKDILGFDWPPDVMVRELLRLPVELDYGPVLAAGLLVFGVGTGLWFAARRRGEAQFNGQVCLAVSMAMMLMMVVLSVLPAAWAYGQKPLAGLAEKLKVVPQDVPIIHLGVHKPSVLYLSQRHFTKLERALQLPSALPTTGNAVIVTEERELMEIQREMREMKVMVVIDECTGGYCLLVANKNGVEGAQ